MDIPKRFTQTATLIITSSAVLGMFPWAIEWYSEKEKEEHLKEWSKENPYIKKKGEIKDESS